MLLDANAFIALTWRQHIHHERVRTWLGTKSFAVCPIVEGALVRFLVRLQESNQTITTLLKAIKTRSGYELWTDEITYADVDLSRIQGHKQVTDTYLVALAEHHGTQLATLDEGLATNHPSTAMLIPPLDR